tara:strand:+ start:431 stop:763 length:333 start_codon:yes stop_codon:yes gene_type:complete
MCFIKPNSLINKLSNRILNYLAKKIDAYLSADFSTLKGRNQLTYNIQIYPREQIFVVSFRHEYEETNHCSLLKACWAAAKPDDFNWIVFMLLDSFLLELPEIYYLHYRKR